MTRKLYTAPIIHPIGTHFKELFQVSSNANDMVNQTSSDIIDAIHKKLKGKNIDRIFLESSYTKFPAEKITYEPLKSLCNDLGINEIEKTESPSSYFSHALGASYMMFAGDLGRRIYNVFMRKRDYEMAKHISKGLKDGETGLLIFGAGHQPEGYVKAIAPDIKVERIIRRKDMIERLERMVEKLNDIEKS